MVNLKIVTPISAVIASIQPVANSTFAQEPFHKGKTLRHYDRSYVLPPDTPKDRVHEPVGDTELKRILLPS